jgi:hypothetical protein
MRKALTLDVGEESLLELCDPGGVNLVQEPAHSAVDHGHLAQNFISGKPIYE